VPVLSQPFPGGRRKSNPFLAGSTPSGRSRSGGRRRVSRGRSRSKEDPRETKARDRAATTPRRRGLTQALHVRTRPLPNQARRAPILRANPYSEVTDPICRLPLPTLFYRLEALHLGDLLRIWVRTGAKLHVALPRIFKVRGDDRDTAATAVLFAFQTLSLC
jgi:hypothetical protein